MYTVWLGRFLGFLFVFFLVTPGWIPTRHVLERVANVPPLLIVGAFILSFIAFAWFWRRCCGLFVINKFFFLFVVYMVLRHCIALTTADFPEDYTEDYSRACMMRYVIFLILLMYCNLLFTTNYDRRSFLNSVYVFGTFFSIIFLVSGPKASTCYVLLTKPPLLLIVFCVFGLISRKLNYFACFFQVANVLLVSLQNHYNKRASFVLGVFSIVVFVCCFLRKLLGKTIGIALLCLVILCTVFQVQRWSYYGTRIRSIDSIGSILSERTKLNQANAKMYFSRNLYSKVFGMGDSIKNGYPHNIYLGILFSGGLVGVALWSCALVWAAVLFFKFHGKRFVDFVLWSTLGCYLLQSCYIGFFLYPTVTYFIVYYMEYRYGKQRKA